MQCEASTRGITRHGDFATLRFYHSLYEVQAKAVSGDFIAGVSPAIKGLEYVRQIQRVDTEALIANAKFGQVALRVMRGRDRNMPGIFAAAVFHGVGKEILQAMGQSHGVRNNEGRAGGDILRDRTIRFFQRWRQGLQCAIHRVPDGDWSNFVASLPGLHPRKQHDLVDHVGKALALVFDHLAVLPYLIFFLNDPGRKVVAGRPDHRYRRSQFVGDPGDKIQLKGSEGARAGAGGSDYEHSCSKHEQDS